MKIRIKKCSNSYYWYIDEIGKSFSVKEEIDVYYCVHKSDGEKGNVLKQDAEIVTEPEMQVSPSPEHVIGKTSDGKSITMSLKTARDIYKEGTEIAKQWLLENFTKEELEGNKGYTWGESFEDGFWIDTDSIIKPSAGAGKGQTNKNIFRTKQQAESALAFAQLSHIVAKYNEGEQPPIDVLYTIGLSFSKPVVTSAPASSYGQQHLMFYKSEDAETSLLVNRELWEKYWMV